MWSLTITKAENGYVLSHQEDPTEGSELVTRYTVVEEKAESSEVICTRDLLWEVVDYFNLAGSKHDTERISIETTKKED